MKKINKKIKEVTRRKCYCCGKMATNPYVYHVVPTYSYGAEIPIYQKSGPKTNRVELRGNRKVLVYNYCSNWILKEDNCVYLGSGSTNKYNECYENRRPPELHER